MQADGSFVFDPAVDFNGTVPVITYTIDDVTGASSNVATVSLTVTPVNDAPVASNDSATVLENGTVLIDLLANDSDVDNGATLSVIGVGQTTFVGTDGSVTLTDDGRVIYDPTAAYQSLAEGESALDNFTYTNLDA